MPTTTTTTAGGQVGRSLPRLEARAQGHRARRIHSHLRLPGMLYGKIFRSTVAHGRIKSIDTSAAKKIAGRLSRRHRRRHPQGHPRPLLRAGLPRPADPGDRQGALRRRAGGGGAGRRSARRRGAAQQIVAEYEELPAVYDEVEAMTSKVYRARRAQARRHFRRPQASQGPKNTNLALDSSCAAATWTRPLPRPHQVFEHDFRTQQVHASRRSSRSSRSPTRATTRSPSTPRRRARRSCASRSRGCSAGRRTGCACKVPFLGGGFGAKLYIKLEALAAALSLICAGR